MDPESGYRFYDPAQLPRARLLASLRRIGMPLAEIRVVCDLDHAAAAEAVNVYWHQVVADTAARGRLATFLVESLSEGSSTMSDPSPTLGVRYAARCDPGAVRDGNEDAAYAGERLFAVADGMHGPGGAAASTTAIEALKPLELPGIPAAEQLTVLAETVAEVDRMVRRSAAADHQPVTTLTAILRYGSQLALVHVGDTRANLLRGGELFQLTQDHTYAQSLVDQGKLGRHESATHPQRSLLVRALGEGSGQVEADLALRTALVGDRYLLCSDGLSAVVDRGTLHAALGAPADPEDAVQGLIDLAYARGAPDNIACVVADAVAV